MRSLTSNIYTLYRTFLSCVNRLEGPQTDLPLYASYLPMSTQKDVEFYSDFIAAVPVQIDEVIQLLRTGIREKRTPPQVSMTGVSDNVRSIVTDRAASFLKPLEKIPTELDSMKSRIAAQITDTVPAAFQKLAEFLDDEYTPSLRIEISSSMGYPDGANYYSTCLNFHTTTTMTPKEVHELGLSEVDRIKSEMKKVAADAGEFRERAAVCVLAKPTLTFIHPQFN